MRYISIILLSLLMGGCCSLVTTSEFTFYRGKLLGPVDTTIEIFGDNGGRSIFVNGQIDPGWKPKHPDSLGFFITGGTTPSHDECEHPNHWENGPFEIYIRGAHIQDYHDTISVDDLRRLPLLNPDSVGIELGDGELGVWQLPDIVLKPK